MLTRAEALLASATATLAIAILVAYAPYRLGWRVSPAMVLTIALAGGSWLALTLWHDAEASGTSDAAASVVVAGTALFLLAIARPDWLPVGGGPDLAHHLVLINYISGAWQLVDDPALYPFLGDMMDYTPGSHLLIALAGAWTHVDPLRAVHPVLALTVALKAGFIFWIAYRLAFGDKRRTLAGLTAVILLFAPYQYFAGSFATHSYWPQVVSELFACAAWWTVAVWQQWRLGGWGASGLTNAEAGGLRRRATFLYALFGAAVFVTWPIWIGPVVVLFAVTVLTNVSSGRGGMRAALIPLAIGIVPIALIAAVHTIGRSGRLQIAGTTGFVIRPSPETLGWAFIVMTCIGIVAAIGSPRARQSLVFIVAIALQALVLYAYARGRGADTPYLSLKMMYLAIYPLAVAGAVALSVQPWTAWLAAVALVPAVVYHAAAAPTSPRIVTLSTWKAGLWARAHANRACVDYLVKDGYTGYWLHLAVLGNPRGTRRFDDPATFDPQKAIERWVDIAGLPYAIVDDEAGFSKALFGGTEIVARFDPSIVIKRAGPSVCGPE